VTFADLIRQIPDLMRVEVLVPWMLGLMFGIFVGSTPGLTATMAVALIVPVSFYLEPTAGLALIIGVSFTAIFAGDIPATYLRIPGTPASAAATLDGHEMARRGQGSLALMLDLVCSCLGGLIGCTVLIVIAPQLAHFALRFSHFEYFWLAILGLSLSALVSQGSAMKGLLAATLGVLLSTVGVDKVMATSRFTFDSTYLLADIQFIPAMIGLFGMSEVLRNVRSGGSLESAAIDERFQVKPRETLLTVWRHKWSVLRSALIGTFVGALPGAGADIAAWAAYGTAQRMSKEPEKFGTGVVEGVVAPTSANNGAVAGAWIPALVFGVPGDAVTAIVLGALLMYGIEIGPHVFENSGPQIQSIFAIALITQILLLPAGLLGIWAFSFVMRLPRRTVLVAVMLFSVVGAYAINNDLNDVYMMALFGVLGFFLESQRVPPAPLILGLILGPMVEVNLRTGLIASSGDLWPMFTRPICLLLIALLLAAALFGPLSKLARIPDLRDCRSYTTSVSVP